MAEVEAGSKFQVGRYAGTATADALVSMRSARLEELDLPVPTQPVRPLSELDKLANPFGDRDTADLTWKIAASPGQWRLVRHASGIDVAFNCATSHVTLLKQGETDALLREYAARRCSEIACNSASLGLGHLRRKRPYAPVTPHVNSDRDSRKEFA
jgi:hypothetical protein